MKKIDREAAPALKPTPGQNKTDDRASETRAVIVVPILRDVERVGMGELGREERLAEAVGLARAIELDIRYAGIVMLSKIHPATLLGSGKVAEIGGIIRAEGVEVVIIDHALSAGQQRNLERAWNAKVLDRTGLILEIFADRARSKEGGLQVELARLNYQKGRLVRSWTHLERQRGGFGFLGGPGETQIEADRRAIAERIDSIRSELGVIERTRRLHRKRRKSAGIPVVSLVGYTNAGKSQLFNALSGAGVLAKDMLFATLDPTLRQIRLSGGGSFILSDTVGFISNLPTQLIAAFRATLEEILEADLLLHVRDISSPSSAAQKAEVERVLCEIGLSKEDQAARMIEVWNKIDLLSAEQRLAASNSAARSKIPALFVSAKNGDGLQELIRLIGKRLEKRTTTRQLTVSEHDGSFIHWLYENTEIVSRREEGEGHLLFEVRVPRERERDLDRHIGRL